MYEDETITLEQAFENIQNYAINSFEPKEESIVGFREDPAVISQFSDFHSLPSGVFKKVPVEILEVYGEKEGKLKWKTMAELYFHLVASGDTRVEVARLMRALLAFWDEERKFMFKGKDGKDYPSFEQVRSVDEFYAQHENPKKEKGRSR